MRKTEKYVIFWGGIFSNWAMTPFAGRVAYDYLIPMLGGKNVSFPSEDLEITRRLKGKTYANNEQWMMACKAWFMNDLDKLKEIHAISDPKAIKAKGREVEPFDERLWRLVCEDVVTAGAVAKFTASERMEKEILETGDKQMVEGSPFDRIWGIGIRWDHKDAEDPSKWKGKNGLGKCLDRAKAIIREKRQ